MYAEDDSFCENIIGYKKAKKSYEDEKATKESKASGFLLDKPKEREARRASSMDQWLTNTTSVNDKIAQASVRDGGPSLEVLILQKRDGKIAFLPWQDENEALNGNELPTEKICMKIAKQRLRLPRSLCCGERLEKVIEELETEFQNHFDKWKESSWIHGELILLLDDQLLATLGGVQLQYSEEDGLIEIRE